MTSRLQSNIRNLAYFFTSISGFNEDSDEPFFAGLIPPKLDVIYDKIVNLCLKALCMLDNKLSIEACLIAGQTPTAFLPTSNSKADTKKLVKSKYNGADRNPLSKRELPTVSNAQSVASAASSIIVIDPSQSIHPPLNFKL